MNSPVRRVITGHDQQGKAIIVGDGVPPAVFPIQALPGLRFSEVWRTAAMPVPIDNGADPTVGPLRLAPTPCGSVIRVVDMPPDPDHKTFSADELFSEIAAASASTSTGRPVDTLMHRTETVDYGIVIEGEIWLVVDGGETRLGPGDIVVQRGTNHAWSNRSERNARMVFVLLDGHYAPELVAFSR